MKKKKEKKRMGCPRPGSSLAPPGAELLADEWYSQAVLDYSQFTLSDNFQQQTSAGRQAQRWQQAKDGAASEASEWDTREQAERAEE